MYHDIRYPKPDENHAPEVASGVSDQAGLPCSSTESQPAQPADSRDNEAADSRDNEPGTEISEPQLVVETEPDITPDIPVVAASVVSEVENTPHTPHTPQKYDQNGADKSTPSTESEPNSLPSTSNDTLSDTIVRNGVVGGLVTTEEFVRNVVRFVRFLAYLIFWYLYQTKVINYNLVINYNKDLPMLIMRLLLLIQITLTELKIK